MKKERKVWAMTLIALGWLAPSLLQAQQDSLQSISLQDVVVTATKYPKQVSETGKVLTVIDETQIARSAGKDLSQLLNEQVGLIVNGATSNPGKDKSVYLQGAGTGYTLILLDGIPLNDPSGVGGAFDLRMLPIDQIERIEILKGSQSTLYGTDAIAGVVNLISKSKGTKPFGGSAMLAYGSYNTRKGGVSFDGTTEKISYRVGYTHLKTDGVSEAKDPKGTDDFDKDGFDQNAVQGSIGFRIGENLTIKPYVRYNTIKGLYDDNGFSDSKLNNYTSNILNAGLTGEYRLGNGSINLLYGYDKTDRAFVSDYGDNKYFGRFHHGELFWQSRISSSLQLLTGLSYQNLQMLDEAATGKDPAVGITSQYASLFLNRKALSVELGGRLTSHSSYGGNFTYSFNPSYLVNDQVKVFVNISSGFKAPTLNQLYGQFGPNPDLKPELSRSLEGGIQFFSKDKRFNIRVSAFVRRLKDVIYYSYEPFTPKYINLNQQDDSGAEAEVSGRLNDAFTIRAFYSYVDGYLTDKSSGTDVTTFNLIRRPRNSFGVNLGYSAGQRIFASLNVKTFGRRSDLYFNPTTFLTDQVSLDSYALVDAYVEYRLPKPNLKFFIDGKNLLNQDYMEVYGYNALRVNLLVGVSFGL